jgi:hypothetical protein
VLVSIPLFSLALRLDFSRKCGASFSHTLFVFRAPDYFWLALIAKRAFGVTTAINVKGVFSAVPGPLWRRYFPHTMKTRGGDDGDTGLLPFVILQSTAH